MKKRERCENMAIKIVMACIGGLLLLSITVAALPLQTDTGFVYPTGVKEPYPWGQWLAGGPGMAKYPFTCCYHIGQDISANVGDSVFPISDGEVIYVSVANGWNSVAEDENYGLFVKHKLNTGEEFVALYGHVRPNSNDLKYTSSGAVKPPIKVYKGIAFATVGPFDTGSHLHFGIHPGAKLPASPWGRMPIASWYVPNGPDTNGFVDPIGWITTKQPFKTEPPKSKGTSITVTHPNGGENWITGTPYFVQWNFAGNPGKFVKIELLNNEAGKEPVTLLGNFIPIDYPGYDGGKGLINKGLTLVNINYQPPGKEYKIRVTSITDPKYTDTSDTNFVIGTPTPTPTPTPTITFSKIFGTAEEDQGMMAKQTSDGGYIMVGNTNTGITGSNSDALLVKTDKNGKKLWQKPFGGPNNDNAYSVAETQDGGYIFVGFTTVSLDPRKEEGWVVKVKKDGTKEWEKTITGGPNPNDYGSEGFKLIEPTSDGGFIISGRTNYNVVATRVYMQVWLVKLDKNYNIVWNKAYGSSGAYKYYAVSAKQTLDGSYLVAVPTGSPGSWVLKVDSNGKELSWKGFIESGFLDYRATDMTPTSDGGYVLLGYKRSSNAIAWLAKIDSNDITTWIKTYEEVNNHVVMNSIQQTKDSEYIMAGSKFGESDQKGMVIKAGSDGSEKDRKVSSETNQNHFQSIKKTSDGGYILAGSVWSSVTKNDAWLVKTDVNVNI